MAPYPPGCEIQLADGRRGVVVSVPLHPLELPAVRVLWDAEGRLTQPEEIGRRERPLLLPPLASAA